MGMRLGRAAWTVKHTGGRQVGESAGRQAGRTEGFPLGRFGHDGDSWWERRWKRRAAAAQVEVATVDVNRADRNGDALDGVGTYRYMGRIGLGERSDGDWNSVYFSLNTVRGERECIHKYKH